MTFPGHCSSWALTPPIRWFCAYRWRVGIRARAPQPITSGTLTDFKLLAAPYGHFYADPFIVEEGDRVFLFLEDYSYFTRTARLVCSQLDASGQVIETRPIIEPEYHISYPQVFSVEGTYYMIPETAAANRVELYRATRFPWEWKLERVLIEGAALHDPTHAIVNGRHWILAGGSSSNLYGQYDLLHVFHAPTVHDDFRPHPSNPVKKDAASARPAGRITVDGDRLIRPSQDCSRWYGCGLNFMAIDTLTESAYSEHRIGAMPDCTGFAGCIGAHTYNASARFEVIDLCSYTLEFPAFVGRACSLVRRVAGIPRKTRPLPRLDTSRITPG